MTANPNAKSFALMDMQKQVLREVLDARRASGEIKSALEYESELTRLTTRIEESGRFTEVAPQTVFIESDAFNRTFEGVEHDLKAIYRFLSSLSESAENHTRLDRSALSQIERRIQEAEAALTKAEYVLDKRSDGEMFVETFSTNDGFESDQSLYQERNGQVASILRAAWEPAAEAIRLPGLPQQFRTGDVRLGKVSVLWQAGKETETKVGLQNILDEGKGSYWTESIWTEKPFTHGIECEDPGAAVELEVRFDHSSDVNELLIQPFTEYPMDLVRVLAYASDDIQEKGEELLDAQIILEKDELIRFPERPVKRVRLLFNQRHYVKRDLLVSTQAERNALLMNRATELNGLHEMKAEEVLRIIRNDERKRVTKYEYQYGLYSLEFRKNEFAETGIFVSRPVPVDGNLQALRIETDEHHPAGAQATAIEYSAHDGTRWHPLLPVGQVQVKQELLTPGIVGGVHEAKTRFEVADELVIQKDGKVLEEGTVLLEDNRTILFREYDPAAYYTASYLPVEGANEVNFVNAYRDEHGMVKPNRLREEFSGTDASGRIALANHPFVDRQQLNAMPASYNPSYLENVYLPLKVTLVDSNGYRIEQPLNEKYVNLHIKNRTDYMESGEVFLDAFDDHTAFYQYVVEGNELRFNTVLPKDTRVIVEYPSLLSTVRLRAILRRNAAGAAGITPELHGYVVHCHTLK